MKGNPVSRFDRLVFEFTQAQENLNKVERLLNAAVGPKIRAANTLDALSELLDELPKRYPGRRRIYEKMNRLDEAAHPAKVTPLHLQDQNRNSMLPRR